jgi:hypothetical protein
MKELFISTIQILLSVGITAFILLFCVVISCFVFNKFVDEISESNKDKENKGGYDNDVREDL